MPRKPFVPTPPLFYQYRYVRAVPLTETEKHEHKIKYYFYNYLWGDSKEKHKEYYKQHREEILYKKRIIQHYPKVYEVHKGLCDMDCQNCSYADCILPKYDSQTEYMRLYKQTHKERIREINKKSYEKNRLKILAKQKEHRAKPEVKKACAEYDKKYRECHKEQRKETMKRYYEKHKDEINAKKRAKRKQEQKELNINE